MLTRTDDVRIQSLRPLLPPAIVMEELPASEAAQRTVTEARAAVADVLHGRGDRLVVVVGPCSVHDPEAALDYAKRLKMGAERYADDLVVIMRTYFEKPRTTVGWKGLINDPRLDGSFSINEGIRVARKFLLDVIALDMPTATEFLDPITPQFLADIVSWGAIGARTTESQVHRELASGLSMPVGFKNGTGGSVQIALDAVRSAANPHHFLSVTKQGIAAIVETLGNPNCHVILRGGGGKPNYSVETVDPTLAKLKASQLAPRLMVDCNHANSSKDHRRQSVVSEYLAQQIEAGNDGIFGVMIESFLEEGRQDNLGVESLKYGQSITDACLGWKQTEPVLECLAKATASRRAKR